VGFEPVGRTATLGAVREERSDVGRFALRICANPSSGTKNEIARIHCG